MLGSPPLPQPEGALAKPMTFELTGGGRLIASGTITPGVSQSFAAEAERHGEYIRTVVLNSPGGSVTDALAMPSPPADGNRTISASSNTVRPVTINYSISGKAIFGIDYTLSDSHGQSGQITIPLGAAPV